MRKASDRRQRRFHVQKQKTRFSMSKILVAGIAIILSSFVIIYGLWKLLPATWEGKSRLVVAVYNPDSDASVMIFDPDTRTITSLLIPPNTQIDAARQLGSWKVGSIWELGKQEKLGGELFAHSITKSFKFPVDAWSDETLLQISQGGLSGVKHALSYKGTSSLTLKDKVRIALFSFQNRTGNSKIVDLRQTTYLKKAVLNDGEDGYIVNGDIPSAFMPYFSDNIISDLNPRIALFDETKRKAFSDTLGEIIQVLGGKVYSVYDRPSSDVDCVVRGESSFAVTKIASILKCSVEVGKTTSDFDIEIHFGEQFESRF